jgi:uncharacterized membrane protein YfhO
MQGQNISEVLNVPRPSRKISRIEMSEKLNKNKIDAKNQKANLFSLVSDKIQKRFPKFNGIRSLSFFLLTVAFIGFMFMAFSLFSNHGTSLYSWDYTWQYVNFSYYFWDVWHGFLRTGQFEMYSYSTYLGGDNIGMNSYYGLFDPFFLPMIVFPRSWIPQMFAVMGIAKFVCAATTMRAYLRYMGIKDDVSDLGGIAFAFSGFTCFMIGFPTIVSVVAEAPLVLLGIEKVIRERKPACLVIGLGILGITSFFYLVTFCIWGVVYALWRFFWSLKTRSKKENIEVIVIGVASFAAGIMLSAWTLIPSMTEALGSGRTEAIGKIYIESISSAFCSGDIGKFLSMIFGMVGNNPGRELMPLISFFYPSTNYLWLPIAESGYDAWTSSIYCQTAFGLMIIYAIIGAIRRREWQTLIGTAICTIMLFTIFPYYFFFAFSGDGYGRWFIVLIPEMIYLGCKELSRIDKNPDWQILLASILDSAMTLGVFFIAYFALNGKVFTTFNTADTYYQSIYYVPGTITLSNGQTVSLAFIVFIQTTLSVVYGALSFLLRKNPKRLVFVISDVMMFEIVIVGTFSYSNSWGYDNFNGGPEVSAAMIDAVNSVKAKDAGFYRSYSDTEANNDNAMAFGYYGSSTFHSLYNRNAKDLSDMLHCMAPGIYGEAYGKTTANEPWVAFYGNKRLGSDGVLGVKYYFIIDGEENGSVVSKGEKISNIPFGSQLVYSNDIVSAYSNPNSAELGHAADGGYWMRNPDPSNYPDDSDFLSSTLKGKPAFDELLRNEECLYDGAIFEKASDVPESAKIEKAPVSPSKHVDISGKLRYSFDFVPNSYKQDWDNPIGFEKEDGTESNQIADATVWWNAAEKPIEDGKTLYIVIDSSDGLPLNSDADGAYFAFSLVSSGSWEVYSVGVDGKMLSYENAAVSDYISSDMHDSPLRSNLFGLYSKGITQKIIMRSINSAIPVESPYVYKIEENDAVAWQTSKKDSEHALSNVFKDINSLSFDTHFKNDKTVVTQICYETGFSLRAKKNGIFENIKTFKLNGGLLGFEAPAGDVSYVLSYETPYLSEWNGMALFSLTALLAYTIAFEQKKKKDEFGTLATRGSI